MPTLQPVVRLTFTVTDPTRSAEFYNQVFGTETILAASDDIGDITIVGNSANTIGLRRHTVPTCPAASTQRASDSTMSGFSSARGRSSRSGAID